MDHLARIYSKLLDLNRADFVRIDHSDTIVSIVYLVTQPSERNLILKVCTRDEDYYRELYFLNSLKKTLPVPQVIKTIEPINDRPGAILLEYLDGSLLQENDWNQALAYEVGTKLASLHRHRTKNFGDLTKPHRLTPNAYDYFKDKFYEELEECSNHLSEKVIKQCKHYFDSQKQVLFSVDGPCIVHRDFRPGNIVIHKGQLIGIIDWASGRSGFAEQDFCSMEHRKWPKNPVHKQSLFEGYSSVRPLPDFNSIMPLLQLGRALAVIGFTVKSSTWNGKYQKLYQYNCQFIDRFLPQKMM